MMTMAVSNYTNNHNQGTSVSFLRLHGVLISLICLSCSANGFVVTHRRRNKYCNGLLVRAGNNGYESMNTNRRNLSSCNSALWNNRRNDDETDLGQDGEGSFDTEEDLQAKLNKITSADELPLFSFDYNPDAYDNTKLAVPPFTAYIIFLFSILNTAYLFYLGIHGLD